MGHKDKISALDLNPQRSMLVTGSWDQTCKIFMTQKMK